MGKTTAELSAEVASLPPYVLDIINQKRDEALIAWAIKKMGNNYKRYKAEADKYFVTSVYFNLELANEDLVTAIKKAQYRFPVSLKPRRWTSQPNPIELIRDYRRYQDKACRLPTKGQRTEKAKAFVSALGIPFDLAWRLTAKKNGKKLTSSYIAYNCVAFRHGLVNKNGIPQAEVVKNHLWLNSTPGKFAGRILRLIKSKTA